MQRINADLFRQMLLQGAKNLEMNRAAVDALNVFPVPDGDTGTNMNLTLQSVVKSLQQVKEEQVGALAAACATGSLMGARGNSGVILSQLFRGFGRSLEGKRDITPHEFASALEAGVETVYKAVRKPVEGTILTVMRESAAAAVNTSKKQASLEMMLESLILQAKKTLAKTPDMLPILKHSGVVDAGGQGLLFIYEGFMLAATGKVVDVDAMPEQQATLSIVHEHGDADIEFGYCTEFLILNPSTDENHLHAELEAHGDSLLVVGDSSLLKIHIHTNNPGSALQLGLQYGELSGIKIENMREQHSQLHTETEAPPEPEKPAGLVAVATGSGLEEIFRSLGVDVIVQGGQTMNPSTEDLAKAVNSVSAPEVILLPNNKNIIMAAEQVQELTDKKVHVLSSRSIPQGLAALMSYMPEPDDVAAMAANMARNMRQVKTGQVTVAVRDHNGSVGEIKEGDLIGLLEGEITVCGKDLSCVATELIEQMLDDESGLITIFYGEEVEAELAEALADSLSDQYPEVEVEVRSGGQAVYHFIISVD